MGWRQVPKRRFNCFLGLGPLVDNNFITGLPLPKHLLGLSITVSAVPPRAQPCAQRASVAAACCHAAGFSKVVGCSIVVIEEIRRLHRN